MKLRPIGHDDRLSIIDHLDELRSRIIICGATLLLVFCVCFWQNHALLSVLNRALPPAAHTGLGDQPKVNADIGATFKSLSADASELGHYLSQSRGVPAGASRVAKKMSQDLLTAGKQIPKETSQQAKPIAIGVGEAFTTTIVVCAYFALLITLPLILYQLYAFIIPALSKEERRVATPTVIAAPVLFLVGAVFTYFAILPPAVHFLQGYNSNQFQNLVQAKSYYKFEILLLMGIGLAFQIPLLALGLQRVGIISSSTLTLNWRYILVLIAVVVAALPGVDPVTMSLEMLPLLALYLSTILLLKWVEYREFRRTRAEAARAAKAGDPGTS